MPAQISPTERKLVLLLKEERERQGVSANQLASRIKVDRSTITRLEGDLARPTLWVLLAIAKGLGVKLSRVATHGGEVARCASGMPKARRFSGL